ncbi:MAG: branched-chain amino acid ABC transporter permease [Atopobiaceae bacterium]|uniref:branched-chain amino acid ABC transporter permease n=1 Tax=Paratractidigestivibacter faecalis TaxID=2292441 RepID=UPI000F5346ED|nr:branched-chain amino acid ABC transporter permease [Coriobacteriaceae bacterium]
MTFITQVLNGLQLGSIYALVALGYTMVYGIILLLNFAHGDIIMVGAYISWLVMSKLGLNPAIAVVLSIVGCMLLGVLIDKVAYAPLRDAPRLSILITAIGVSYFLENGSQLLFGADAKVVPAYTSVSNIQVGDLTLSFSAIVTVVVTAVATVVLTFLVQKTKLGKAMRAVSEDMGAARLMGINVNTTISFTFAVGSALAGIGAVLYCMAYTQASPTMGIMLGTKAFVAAVLGGIGSIPGAVIGGLLVGFAEVFVSAIGLSVWQDAVVFLLLIVVLIVKPTGLLGRPMTEKV